MTDPFYAKLTYKPCNENYNRYELKDPEIWFLVGCHPVIQNLQIVLRQYSEWSRTNEEVDATIQLRGLLSLCERNTYLRLVNPQNAPSVEMKLKGVPPTQEIHSTFDNSDSATWIAEPVGV